jgi:NADPH-dependent 2,4-dienoyl-CoA reductase/sulfur reductase-like enzyme
MACAVNADVGFERVHEGAYDRVTDPRTVLVVGGGPAGMEAARVAARRGHRVVLCEATAELGGNMRHARRFPHRELMGDIVAWLEAEIGRLGVEVRRSTLVDADVVAALAPDAVIVATGGRTELEPGQWSSIDIASLDGPPAGVRTAVVVDRFGAYEAVGVSELLVGWGVDVTVVTPHPMLGPRILRELVLVPALDRMQQAPGRFQLVTDVDLDAPLPETDLVVVVDREPAPLATGLPDNVVVVGDAAEAGHLWAAVRSGNAAGRAV